MPTESINEIWKGRVAEWSEDGSRTYERVYLVRTSAIQDAAYVVGLCPISLYDPYPSDPGSLCRSIKPTQEDDDAYTWTIQVSYSTATRDEPRGDQDPTQRPPEYTWTSETVQEAYHIDLLGNATLNSAGMPFDPTPVRDTAILVLTIQRNEADFDPVAHWNYVNKVNDAEFLGFSSGQVRCTRITADRKYSNDQEWWDVNYEFKFKPNVDNVLATDGVTASRRSVDGWDDIILDAGTMEIGINGILTEITSNSKFPLTGPVRLNGEGVALDFDAPADESVWVVMQPYDRADFNDFEFT